MIFRLSRAAIASLALGVAFSMTAAFSPVAAQSAERVLATGTWTKKSYASAGTWTIVERDGETVVRLSADFRTQNAPDLKLFLSPLAAEALTGKNATDGALLIAPLTSSRGAQEYSLPEGADLSRFTTIIIHCEAFSKLWSVAEL